MTVDSEPTSSTTTTAGGDLCGNSQPDEGEACDNGELNNGKNGSICKSDCQLNTCGDGYPASMEGCDDGNLTDGDGCGADCKLEGCGDGVLKPPEECDDNNMLDGDGCSSLCKLPFCGDNTMDPGEQCDAGPDNLDTNACTMACKDAVCGDGLLLEGIEVCDDGNADENACTGTCNLPTCGDGKVQAGEECDDQMNGDPDDGCTDSCKNPACGDGLLQPSLMETCDDGATDPGDGCSATCQKECGNGAIDLGEQCDDKNAVVNDTCDNSCARVAYHVFVTSQMYPADFEGIIDADAACNMLATAANLPGAGNFQAWLSTKVDGENPGTRMFKSNKPYVLTTNIKVANNWADLVDGDITTPITITEAKMTATAVKPINCNAGDAAAALVWTNTNIDGTAVGIDCSNWSVVFSDQEGGVGMLNRKDVLWTDACPLTCDKQARFYCFEQPPD